MKVKKSRRSIYLDPEFLKKGKQRFKKGNPGGPVGKRGPHKKTIENLKGFTSLKQSFIDAFNDERIGGTEGLVLWILERRTFRQEAFYNWIARMLPRSVDVNAPEDSTLERVLKQYQELSASELKAKAASLATEVLRASRTPTSSK